MPVIASARPGRRPDPTLQDLWRQRFLRFEHAGLSVVAFCAHEGVSTPSFYAWRQRLRQPPAVATTRSSTASPTEFARLVPVRVRPAVAPVEILLPGGVVVRLAPGCDLDFVRALVTALEGKPC